MADYDQLQSTFDESEIEYIPLKVSSGILLHIGAGIYSSVAGAIKELVSNAYDADATRITITTNYPDFDQITVVDNGSGMTEATFAKAMSSIGSSLKRELTPQGVTPIYKRPIIGHLGIGLMALSQVCDVAFIESQAAESDTRFVAKLDFSAIRNKSREQTLVSTLEILQERQQETGFTTEEKNRIQTVQDSLEALAAASVAQDAKRVAKRKRRKLPQGEHLGYCLIYPRLPAIPGGQGTKITLYPLDPAVVATFKDQNRNLDALPKRLLPDEYQLPSVIQETKTKRPRNLEEEERLWQERRERVNAYGWRELCELLRQYKLAYQELPQYHQFLWELAVMSPVRYFSDSPVTVKPVLQDERKKLEEFKFSVIVDNRELFKPILLPSANIARIDPSDLREDLDYFVDTFKHTIQVGEGRNQVELRFRGYLFWQRSQIQPSTIRGIKIYIRNVGIGLYDHTLLNFSAVNPTSRAGQLSGEIYVESGLENALNVDRNSFRETDAEYLALRDYIWKRLGSAARTDGVLGRSVDSYWERKKIKEKEEERRHLVELRERVDRVTNGKVEVELSHTKGDQRFVEENRRKLIVHLGSADWPRSAVDRRRVQRIMIPLKAAVMSGFSPEELLKLLDELL